MPPDFAKFYSEPGEATVLPEHPVPATVPNDADNIRAAVQGVLLHAFLAGGYGVHADSVRQTSRDGCGLRLGCYTEWSSWGPSHSESSVSR